MHALSLGTWWIHLASLFEWMLAILLVVQWGKRNQNRAISWLGIGILARVENAQTALTSQI
ncbi:MAG: DUF2499 domain-containing protein, partial [Cyanobacteriota bacterium]|nr:DUF2499 domain-containing protein [Cyanobacteriota bacterium]